MKKLSEQFNTIAVKKGEFFTVDLASNGASTGYMWDLQVTTGKAATIRKDYIDPASRKDDEFVCGNTIIERTIMQAQEDGVIEISADWKRPWEKTTPPAKSLKFKVNVG